MKRRTLLALTTALLMAPGLLLAGPMEDQIIAQLRDQGYRSITVSRTLLGRTRFVATSEMYRREIILNPRTGEILRDLWETIGGGNTGGAQIINQGSSSGSSGTSADDDDEDDDDDDEDDDDDDDDEDDRDDDRDDDDEDDEDNSGSGKSGSGSDDEDDDEDDDNSGSGSGNSGSGSRNSGKG